MRFCKLKKNTRINEKLKKKKLKKKSIKNKKLINKKKMLIKLILLVVKNLQKKKMII